MKQFFQIVLVLPDGVQNIKFLGSAYQAEKAFFALSFALCNSSYLEMLLFSGNIQINKTSFTHHKVR